METNEVDTQVMHKYIRENVSEFNISGSNDKTDVLEGEAGKDVLFGQGGNDTLDGGTEEDTLIGGLGDDYLIGGDGADTFVWLEGDIGTDHIEDFDVNEGDVLDLSDILQLDKNSNLDDFLTIVSGDDGTTITVHANGDENEVTQEIILDGVTDLGSENVTIVNDLLTGAGHEGALFLGDNVVVDSITMDITLDDHL